MMLDRLEICAALYIPGARQAFHPFEAGTLVPAPSEDLLVAEMCLCFSALQHGLDGCVTRR